MRQRLVLRFDTFYDDYNSKSDAMKTIVGADGVTSVTIDEKDETKMEVIGEEMDVNGLLKILKRRNFKAQMEKLEEIKHGKNGHHEKDKKNEHHKKEREERKHKKDKKKKKSERKDKKKHAHSDSDSDSGSSKSSSSDSESDSGKKNRRQHHNHRSSSSSSSSSGFSSGSESDQRKGGHQGNGTTYIYQPTYPTQIYPAPPPYDNGYNYKYPNSRYSDGYNQDTCSIM